MNVHFLGAAQTVTGSCYMIESGGRRFAVDCGMHQGNAAIDARNDDTGVYRAGDIDFFLVTHAHIDHSGLLPKMAAEGFKGPIYCTEPTAALLDIMLADSAHIQEMEAEWATRKQKRKGARPVAPLYTKEDAATATRMLSPVSYNSEFSPAPGVRVTYKNAGHILGAAFLEVVVDEGATATRIIFSGDLGRPDALITEDPDTPELKADYLFLESTYGDRNHKDESTSRDELAEAVAYSVKRGGKVIIPAFAVERTQEVLYSLYLLRREGRLPAIPIYLDSPLAIKATDIFRRFPHYADDDLQTLVRNGEDPFSMPEIRYTPSTAESRAINDDPDPAIIIAGSGMCNAGRIKHHLRHNLWRPEASIVFVGYQGVGTPGRKIVDGATGIRLLGEDTAVKARVFTINGFSAHAGQSQILDWVAGFEQKGMRVILTHGEETAQTVLAGLLRERFGLEVHIPEYLEEMTLVPGREIVVQVDRERARPALDWNLLIGDMEGKVALLRARSASLPQRDWAAQTEMRDKLLEINGEILRLVSQV
jgi:metallo-beta-lactamase family protein